MIHAHRFFFGLGKASLIAALIGDVGWVPLQMRLEYTMKHKGYGLLFKYVKDHTKTLRSYKNLSHFS